MTKQHCCGVDSYKDFQNSKFRDLNFGIVPQACCKLNINNELSSGTADSTYSFQPTPSNSYMNQGCYEKIQQWWERNYILLTGIMVIVVGAYFEQFEKSAIHVIFKMDVGCNNNCTKYILGVVNFLLMLGSFTMFCIGIWMLADGAAFTKLAQISNSVINEEQKEALELFADRVDMTIFGYALIVVGVIVFIVSLLGFCETLCGLRRNGYSLTVSLIRLPEMVCEDRTIIKLNMEI